MRELNPPPSASQRSVLTSKPLTKIMAYNELIDFFNAKYTGDDEDANLWTYDKVLDHRKGPNGKVEVCVLWMMVLKLGNPFC